MWPWSLTHRAITLSDRTLVSSIGFRSDVDYIVIKVIIKVRADWAGMAQVGRWCVSQVADVIILPGFWDKHRSLRSCTADVHSWHHALHLSLHVWELLHEAISSLVTLSECLLCILLTLDLIDLSLIWNDVLYLFIINFRCLFDLLQRQSVVSISTPILCLPWPVSILLILVPPTTLILTRLIMVRAPFAFAIIFNVDILRDVYTNWAAIWLSNINFVIFFQRLNRKWIFNIDRLFKRDPDVFSNWVR